MPDDATHTLGRTFRTPAHPDLLAAMGRALFNFLLLEELATAVLLDAGGAPPATMRGMTAGGKQETLNGLANLYRASSNGKEIAEVLDTAVAAFGRARTRVRNEVLHSYPYTEGQDADGTYRPGLAYTAKDAKSSKTIARSPEDMLDLAAQIEEAIDLLSEARDAVKRLPVTAVEP